MDILFFKENVHLPGFEITDGLQQHDRISCKAGDGLGDHHINFSGMAVGNKPLKIRSGILRTGLGFIGIDACIEPVAISLDKVAVMADLCGQRVKHGVLATGNTGVGCDSLFTLQLRRF